MSQKTYTITGKVTAEVGSGEMLNSETVREYLRESLENADGDIRFAIHSLKVKKFKPAKKDGKE